MGCDGRLLRQVISSPGENAAAYGEVVWSWRRDPGVYPVRLCGPGNGDNKGRSPGRARISRKPLRGESRDVSAVPVKSVCVLVYHCTRCCGRSRRPAFPAPSAVQRGKRECTTQAKSRRENESVCLQCALRVCCGGPQSLRSHSASAHLIPAKYAADSNSK